MAHSGTRLRRQKPYAEFRTSPFGTRSPTVWSMVGACVCLWRSWRCALDHSLAAHQCDAALRDCGYRTRRPTVQQSGGLWHPAEQQISCCHARHSCSAPDLQENLKMFGGSEKSKSGQMSTAQLPAVREPLHLFISSCWSFKKGNVKGLKVPPPSLQGEY